MPAPQGTDLQFGYRYEQSETVPAGNVNLFFRPKSITGIVPVRGFERVGNLDPSGQTLKSIPTTARIGGKIDFEPDVNSIAYLLQHACDKLATTSNPTGSVYQHLMTPREFSEAAPATYVRTLFAECTDGDGYPIAIYGMGITGFEFKISEGKLVDCSMDYLACFDTYQSQPTVVSAPATYTGTPVLRGHRGSTVTGTLKMKITAAAGGGYSGTAKFSLASYAGSTTCPFVFDTWTEVFLDTGVRGGQSDMERLMFLVPSTPTPSAVAADDEWSFAEARTLATASYSSLDVLSAAGLTLTVDGAETEVREATVKLMFPKKWNTSTKKYPRGLQKNGPVSAMVSITRDRDNRTFLSKLISGASAAMILDMKGNPIATGYDERLKINMPNYQVTKDQRDVSTATTLPESVDLTPHRSGTTDIFDITVINTTSALV